MISIPMQTFSNFIHLLLAFWYRICLIWKQICDTTLPVWMIDVTIYIYVTVNMVYLMVYGFDI